MQHLRDVAPLPPARRGDVVRVDAQPQRRRRVDVDVVVRGRLRAARAIERLGDAAELVRALGEVHERARCSRERARAERLVRVDRADAVHHSALVQRDVATGVHLALRALHRERERARVVVRAPHRDDRVALLAMERAMRGLALAVAVRDREARAAFLARRVLAAAVRAPVERQPGRRHDDRRRRRRAGGETNLMSAEVPTRTLPKNCSRAFIQTITTIRASLPAPPSTARPGRHERRPGRVLDDRPRPGRDDGRVRRPRARRRARRALRWRAARA
eukprot:31085-Pelagococcus_subviridis.AAC.20